MWPQDLLLQNYLAELKISNLKDFIGWFLTLFSRPFSMMWRQCCCWGHFCCRCGQCSSCWRCNLWKQFEKKYLLKFIIFKHWIWLICLLQSISKWVKFYSTLEKSSWMIFFNRTEWWIKVMQDGFELRIWRKMEPKTIFRLTEIYLICAILNIRKIFPNNHSKKKIMKLDKGSELWKSLCKIPVKSPCQNQNEKYSWWIKTLKKIF